MTKLDKEIQQELYDPETQGKMKGILHYAIDKLFDPKAKGKAKKGTLKIIGDKSKLTRLKKHLKKEHPSTKGHIKVLDPTSRQKAWEKELKAKAHEGKKLKRQQTLTSAVSTSKRLSEYAYDIKGIADSLRRQGIEADLHDIAAEYDHSLSHSENLKHIKELLGLGGRKSSSEYEKMAEEFYKAQTMGTREGWLAKASPQERAAAFARMRETGTLRGYDPKKPAEIYVVTDSKGNKHKASYAEWLKWMKEQAKRMYDPKSKKPTRFIVTFGAHRTLTKHEFATEKEAQEKVKELSEKMPNIVFKYRRLYDPDPKTSLPPARWYEAMVKGIKKRSDVRNPYAIVKNIWARLKPSKRSEIQSREAKGEVFSYDLPLPKDVDTKGTGTLRMVKPFKLAEAQVNVSAKDMKEVKKSGIFKPMRRQDGTTAQVARCKSKTPVNIFVDQLGGK